MPADHEHHGAEEHDEEPLVLLASLVSTWVGNHSVDEGAHAHRHADRDGRSPIIQGAHIAETNDVGTRTSCTEPVPEDPADIRA